MSIDQPPPRSGGLGKFGAAPRSLGSLAQSARTKQIKQARVLMYVIGFFQVIVSVLAFVLLNSDRVANLDPELLTVLKVGAWITLGTAVVFVVLGALTLRYPVPTTILALVIYGTQFALGLIDGAAGPSKIGQMIIPIIIMIALIRSVQAAIVYQREKNQSAGFADPLA